MKKLDEMQITYLTTDTTLAAEIIASNSELRCFIAIFAYQNREPKSFAYGFVRFDKFVKNVDLDNVFFALRKYEILKEHMEKSYDDNPCNFINKIYLEDIKGIQNIENELLKHIDDLSVLQPIWKCDMLL